VSNVDAPNFIKHTLEDLRPQIDPNTVVVGDFNTPLLPIDRSRRGNYYKEGGCRGDKGESWRGRI
jgi:hypothetical protein